MCASLVVAGGLLVPELVLGIGLLGGCSFLVSIVAVALYLSDRKMFPDALRIAVVYAILTAATLWWIQFNWKTAQHRAGPLIVACENFRVAKGRYPASLDELVPEFMPTIPNAKYTLLGRHFIYDHDRPALVIAVMFHGVSSYDFPTRSWRTNE